MSFLPSKSYVSVYFLLKFCADFGDAKVTDCRNCFKSGETCGSHFPMRGSENGFMHNPKSFLIAMEIEINETIEGHIKNILQ